MDELYRIHSSFSSCTVDTDAGGGAAADHRNSQVGNLVPAGFRFISENEVMGSEMSDFLKAQIANHPLYPNLISAYIECRKVGAPPEMVSLLEDISKDTNYQHPIASPPPTEIGADPELDQFMESYCEALNKYKEELLKPFHEATTFLKDIESQLINLCKDNLTTTTTTTTSFTSVNYHSDEAAGVTSDEDLSCGEVEVAESQESLGGVHQAETELKEMLMRKYSGYLSSLRKEFLKKRKKGKLPKNARMTLLDWWNTHYRWPYPTEDEKNKLSEVTGLDQRQINNWFINQRKRHWRPSEDMRFALMQGVTGTVTAPAPMYFDSAGGPAGFGT